MPVNLAGPFKYRANIFYDFIKALKMTVSRNILLEVSLRFQV